MIWWLLLTLQRSHPHKGSSEKEGGCMELLPWVFILSIHIHWLDSPELAPQDDIIVVGYTVKCPHLICHLGFKIKPEFLWKLQIPALIVIYFRKLGKIVRKLAKPSWNLKLPWQCQKWWTHDKIDISKFLQRMNE